MERKARLEVDGVKYRLVKLKEAGEACDHCAIRDECFAGVYFCSDHIDDYWEKVDAAEDDVGVLQGESIDERLCQEAMEE